MAAFSHFLSTSPLNPFQEKATFNLIILSLKILRVRKTMGHPVATKLKIKSPLAKRLHES